MKVAFHSRLLTERGSEGAMLEYARLNRSILHNDSFPCLPAHHEKSGHPLLTQWRKEFPVIFYQDTCVLASKLSAEGIEALYLTKPGPFDGMVVPGVKNCIHAQFLCDEFHGDAYAFLSPWMSRVMTGREESYVPFPVPRFASGDCLRPDLGISPTARVFGRHGAWDTFNIPFARAVVRDHARHNPGDHFVFLNTKPIPGTERLANVHYLPATVDSQKKGRFLATCDAMIHARWHGETFGLAVAEFAVLHKPVLTFSGSRERAHLEMLGRSAVLYGTASELRSALHGMRREKAEQTGYETFASPAAVMEIFRKKFLI